MPPTEFEPTDWEGRLQSAVAETLRRRQAERQERAERKAARDWGLAQRHQRKAAHNRTHVTPEPWYAIDKMPTEAAKILNPTPSVRSSAPEILDNPAREVPNGPRES